MIKKFKKEFLLCDVLYGPVEGVEIIKDQITDTTRWSICHDLIFKYEGKFWSTHYQVGTTKYQDEGPWEYCDDEIVCTEVVPYEKTIIEYKPA